MIFDKNFASNNIRVANGIGELIMIGKYFAFKLINFGKYIITFTA